MLAVSVGMRWRRLAGVVSSMLGNMVPVTMTAMEALIRLLGVLEEVDADTRELLHEPLMLKLVSASSAVRHQVCASLHCSPALQAHSPERARLWWRVSS